MKRIFSLAVLSLLATGIAFGQTTSGNMAGSVKDATGAAVPHASVTVTSETTGVATTTVTNGAGDFLVQNLLSAAYDVKTTAQGFAPSLLKGVRVELNSTATADVALSVGTQSIVEEVNSDVSAALDTTSQNLTTTFSNEELSLLPTASIGVGVLNVSLLSPGVASSGGLGIGVGPSVGGQRPRNNNFTIEGIDNNNKAVTGPLVYLPNDAVGNFTLITNQFSPEFGHSSGGQFNTTAVSGTNNFHGRLYEYFQNRNLNAAQGIAGGKVPNPRYDNNRYGAQLGGPIFRNKLFFFANYERNTIGQAQSYYLCTPTAAGLASLNSLSGAYGFSATNLQEYTKYTPAANFVGGAAPDKGIDASNDNACFNQASGEQSLAVTNGGAASTDIKLGNYLVNSPFFTNFDALTTSADYTITSKDSVRGRYIYNKIGTTDTAANLPTFWVTTPSKFYLIALSEYHTFTPNLINEFRLGFNRYDNTLTAGNFSYPGVDSFPNLQFNDQGFISVGPDGNAPQFTIQNLYQATDNISFTKGAHTLKFGFDGRKYISPQGFTQRARGDYQWNFLDEFLHDLAPTSFGERSSGNHTYYGDQTALYGYANDTWRATPTLTFNAGVRYEFTSVPIGERSQALNAIASVPGLIDFHAPKPAYRNFAPRIGIEYAPNPQTVIRAGFGLAYDVLFDNLGTLSFPPQYSSTEDVDSANQPAAGSPNFLAKGGLAPGTGTGVTLLSAADARKLTSAYLPDQVVPYAETYNLTVQHTFGTNYTAEVGYIGTRGIHLPTQIQYDITPRTTAANQLFTNAGSTTLVAAGANATNLQDIRNQSNILPAFKAAGFKSKITSYQPYSSSNYNGLIANLSRRYQNGLQMSLSYTWSKTMDNATDEVFATVLTPRRPEDSQNLNQDYSRSALDRTHRLTVEVVYDLPFYKNSSNFLKKNVIGNWAISPVYTYESPEYATALSGDNANLNGDSGAAIDRPIINPNGVKGTGTGVVANVSPLLAANCDPNATGGGAFITSNTAANGEYPVCRNDTIGYSAGSISSGTFVSSNAYYVQAGPGTLPNASRNTLPIRPIDNVDVGVYKRVTAFGHYSVEVGAQAYNVLNHAQYQPGAIDNVNGPSFTANYNFQTVTSAAFNHPDKVFSNNPRTMQLSAKFIF